MGSIDTRFLAAAVPAGGILTWPTGHALAVHLGASRATAARVLARLTAAKMLRRIALTGEHSDAWLSTPLAAEPRGCKAATRFLGRRPADTWTPGPTLRHDQLALLAAWTFAGRPDDDTPTAASEHEIEQQFTSTAGRHIPDGAALFRVGADLKCVGIEIELSKKSGGVNGKNTTSWAKSLAPSILDRQQGLGMPVKTLGLTLDATLLVAPLAIARQIAGAVRRVAAERDCAPGWVLWSKPDPNALRLGPLHVWQLALDTPMPLRRAP